MAIILQAKTSFVGGIGGGNITINQGDLIDSDHPAVRKWPDKFGPLTVQHRSKPEPRIEQATAAPGEKRGAK